MAARAFESEPGLQKLVDLWLKRLAAEPVISEIEAAPLTQLSPLKKYKGRPLQPTPGRAAILLHLLACRVVRLTLRDCPAEWLVELTGPVPPSFERERLKIVQLAQEIETLPSNLLTGWTLAGLQLAPGGAGQQKRSGSFYTSPELASYITERAIPVASPGLMVLDPACGGGVFLLAALERLQKLEPSTTLLQSVAGRLYGLDLQSEAVTLCRLALLLRLSELNGGPLEAGFGLVVLAQVRVGNALVGSLEAAEGLADERKRFFEAIESSQFEKGWRLYRDREQALQSARQNLTRQIAALPLFNEPGQGAQLAGQHPFGWCWEWPEVFAAGGFGVVVGNPPYVGFNDYSGIEKAYFASRFGPVYNLKSDLFYYFIQRGIEVLRPAGRLGFVTSRFWQEAAFARPLRSWLAGQTRLLEIENFGSRQFFEDASIDVCLLFASPGPPAPQHQVIFRHSDRAEGVLQRSLQDGAAWSRVTRPPAEQTLLAKITERSNELGQLAQCRTGVQTGLDKVFMLSGEKVKELGLEQAALKRAIKNSDISPGGVAWHDRWLVYLPAQLQPGEFPFIMKYLEGHRPALERRRRYDQPFAFYQLQWPREASIFEAPLKLVTPYKSPRNLFSLDDCQYYFSTDVISVVFEPNWGWERLTVNFLNSSLSTFQFRSYGKSMGGGQWDYYANPVKKLAFPRLEQVSPDLLAALNQPNLTQTELDKLVFELYELSEAESQLVEARLKT